MRPDKINTIDFNIIQFFIEKRQAKSGYEIATYFSDRENRKLYSKRLNFHSKEDMIFKEGDYYKLRLTQNNPQMQNYLLQLMKDKDGRAALKRYANLGATRTVKKKTLADDIKKLSKSKKIRDYSIEALDKLKI